MVVRVREGDLRQDRLQVDHHLYDEKMKDLEELKDLCHGERKLVVVFSSLMGLVD